MKNKKLILLVGILLLTGGITFAYFTMSNTFSGNGANTAATTTTIDDATLKVEGALEFNATSMYPGHQEISSIKLTATGDNQLIPYNVIWNGTNSLNTPLNYTIYKTSTNIDVEVTCEKVTKVVDGAQHLMEECVTTNIESLGTAISKGTIETSTEQTKVLLAEEEFITATSDGDIKYYYVILEYPNLNENQNSDIGGSFSGTITIEKSDAEADINILAAYIETDVDVYEKTNDIPQEDGYYLDAEKSVCSNGAIPRWDYDNKELILSDLTTSGTSCYLYFFTIDLAKDIVAASTISTRTDFSVVMTDETTKTLFTAEDDDGTSYYYAGAATDNYVKFAGFYWRIIRINGDGSIRLIYQGESADATGTAAQIGTSAFNSSYNNNMYVGYMYTSGKVHGLGTSSTIKGTLDDWFTSTLSDYTSYLDYNAGFCGDRTSYTNTSGTTSGGGTGTTTTYYGAWIRLYTNKTPDLKCADSSDLYTTSSSSKGNKALTYPIGLITADEVAYAGGVWTTSNTSYYLYTGQYYLTMTPCSFSSSTAFLFRVQSSGALDQDYVHSTRGVHPVINLHADTVFVAGSEGTAENPYRVEGAE